MNDQLEGYRLAGELALALKEVLDDVEDLIDENVERTAMLVLAKYKRANARAVGQMEMLEECMDCACKSTGGDESMHACCKNH